ncbi:MAG: hypothetical protein AVDCRST_MAG09-1215, partial [uncultured Sphingomonas sp.]
ALPPDPRLRPAADRPRGRTIRGRGVVRRCSGGGALRGLACPLSGRCGGADLSHAPGRIGGIDPCRSRSRAGDGRAASPGRHRAAGYGRRRPAADRAHQDGGRPAAPDAGHASRVRLFPKLSERTCGQHDDHLRRDRTDCLARALAGGRAGRRRYAKPAYWIDQADAGRALAERRGRRLVPRPALAPHLLDLVGTLQPVADL